MFNAIIAFSLRQRLLVGLMMLALIAGGVFAFTRLPIDAVPDITNNQVQVLTQAPALSPLEVEQFVTFPIELALKSLPDLVELRSLSKPGISVVTVVFKDDVETYFARQQVIEKLREAEEELPPGAERPELGPVSTGLGEIFRYVVKDTTGKLSPMDLRTVQDWIVRRQLLGVPGLAEVNSLGGAVRQYHVLADPAKLQAFNLTLRDVYEATTKASGNAGGAYIETGPEQFSVRSVGLVTSLDDLRNTVVRAAASGTPVLLGDVATVEIGSALRFGSASQDGTGEVVTGITMQLKDANARVIVNAVKERLVEIQRSLPPGVVIEPYYDREELVDRTIGTVTRNLIEGALLVVGVLILLLANLRAGLILASVIPLAMCFTAICMVLTGQSGNLMSLGALDFGLVVDGSLIIVENVLRLIEKRNKTLGTDAELDDRGMKRLIYHGSSEVLQAAKFGVFIIILVYLPIMTLQGVEGKFFRPMALTVSFALVGALFLSLTYVPMMLSLFLKKKGTIKHSPVIEFLHRLYRPSLRWVLQARPLVLGVTLVLFAISAFVFTRLGGEFIPRLDEGDLSLSVIRLPSVSLTESQKITTRLEAVIKSFPEVKTIVSHTGRAEISTDPMGVEIADTFVILKDPDDWPEVDGHQRTKEELVAAMAEAVESIPGAGVQFLQPIEMRMNELIAGVKGDVAIKVFGEDYAVLNPAAEQITTILNRTPGAADVTMEQTSGQPQLMIRPDRAAIARYGLTVDDVNSLVSTAIGGATVGTVYEGEQRFDIVLRYAAEQRQDVQSIGNMLISTPGGQRVPLSALARVGFEEGPAQVTREDGSRFITVQANVRGRDVQSFVQEVQGQIGQQVKLPAGYNVIYGGQFENLQAASRRLLIVVPISLLIIFLLLFQTFGSLRLGAMIFLCVPLAVIGGVAGLVIAGLPFSISAGVGFIALFGIAVLNGIVMVAAFRKFQGEGLALREAVLAGADERLRAVVTTATLAGFGFIPMLLADGAGAEVQRPLATVIIGGLITSTFLTLFVLPIVYDWLGGKVRLPAHHDEDDGLTDGMLDAPTVESVENTERAPVLATSPLRSGPALGAALLALAMIFGASGAARAQTIPGTLLTLEGALNRALLVAPEVQRSAATSAQARSLRAASGVLPNPEVFYTLDKAGGASDERETAFGLSQTVAFPLSYVAQRRAGAGLIRQADAELQSTRLEIVRRTRLAYLDALVARQLRELADSAVAITGQFAQASERRRELGETNALESLQAAVALAGAERRRAQAVGQANRTLAELATLLGADPNEPFTLIDSLALAPTPLSLAELERRAVGLNPRLQAAGFAVEAAKARQIVVGYQRLPDLTLGYSKQSVAGRFSFYGAELRLGLPLWRLFATSPDRAAAAETRIREAERLTVERGLLAEIRGGYAAYEAALATVQSYTERLLPQAEEAYRIALRLRSSGDAGYLDVLSAQTALVETRSAYVETLHDAARLRAELDALAGPGLDAVQPADRP